MSGKALLKPTAPAQSVLGPRQEELLSYLQGLAPVGQPFEFRRGQVAGDLGFNADGVLYEALRKLVARGFVERLGAGQSAARGRLRVLRRLEAPFRAPEGEAAE